MTSWQGERAPKLARVAIQIQQYTSDWEAEVQSFNKRLASGGTSAEFSFPESHVPDWLPPTSSSRLYQSMYLATSESRVHGGFILKPQEFAVAGQVRTVAHYRLPVSEGIVSKAYAAVGVKMLKSAERMQPLLFALGMGGTDKPLPRMLRAAGWTLIDVPFYFRVVHAGKFSSITNASHYAITQLRRQACGRKRRRMGGHSGPAARRMEERFCCCAACARV